MCSVPLAFDVWVRIVCSVIRSRLEQEKATSPSLKHIKSG